MASKDPAPALITQKSVRLVLMGILVIALFFTAYFGARLIASEVYWNDPKHQFQPVAGWMTPRYVAMSWKVPPEIVVDALDLTKQQRGRKITLEEVASASGKSLGDVTADLEAAITAYRNQPSD